MATQDSSKRSRWRPKNKATFGATHPDRHVEDSTHSATNIVGGRIATHYSPHRCRAASDDAGGQWERRQGACCVYLEVSRVHARPPARKGRRRGAVGIPWHFGLQPSWSQPESVDRAPENVVQTISESEEESVLVLGRRLVQDRSDISENRPWKLPSRYESL